MDSQIIEKEFIMMISQYERIIYKVTSFYLDENNQEDMYQEVVLNLWKAFPQFRGGSAQSTWIYRIALNTCITFYRKNKSRPVHVIINQDFQGDEDDGDNIRELYAMINLLDKLERALVLLYLEDRSYKEIAEIIGLTETNVATKLSRIKMKLKQMFNSK